MSTEQQVDLYHPVTDEEKQAAKRLIALRSQSGDCEYKIAVVIYHGNRQVERFCQHPEHWLPNCQIVEWME